MTLAAEPDRKVVKAAVKAGKAQGAKIVSRVIDPTVADKLQAEIDGMEDEIEEIIAEEKEERQLAQAEMQVRKGENMIDHEEEIKSRPKRTWFETQADKTKSRDAGRAELNGLGAAKKKMAGKLSNKEKKRLDAKTERAEGREWKKGKDTDVGGKVKGGARGGASRGGSRGGARGGSRGGRGRGRGKR